MKPLSDLTIVIRSPVAQAERRQAIRETWAADALRLGAKVFFSVARQGCTINADDLLLTDCHDRHSDLTRRTIEVFRWFLKHASLSGRLFMLDDDCYLAVDRLAALPLEGVDYGGHLNEGYYMSGGPGVLYSRKMVDRLQWLMSRDDVVVGALATYCVKAASTELPGFHPWREAEWPLPENSVVSQHYIRTPKEIRSIHDALEKTRPPCGGQPAVEAGDSEPQRRGSPEPS